MNLTCFLNSIIPLYEKKNKIAHENITLHKK